jgi:lipoprotein-anchoring transpeptidase ErfK/SrfK
MLSFARFRRFALPCASLVLLLGVTLAFTAEAKPPQTAGNPPAKTVQPAPKTGPNTAAGPKTAPKTVAPKTETAPSAAENDTPPPGNGNAKGAGTATDANAAKAPAPDAAGDGVIPPDDGTPRSQILVDIDKSTQEMTVFVDGVEQYTWKVSTGKPGYATPSGTYTATSMNEMWYSKEWDNAPMPHAVFFMKDGHAIHGTTEVKNLGKPASHGCVRLAPENATILFDLVKQNGLANTQVVLSGETPGGDYVASAPPEDAYPPDGGGYAYPPWFNPGARERPRQFNRRGRWFQPFYSGPPGFYPPQGVYPPQGAYPPPGYAPRRRWFWGR